MDENSESLNDLVNVLEDIRRWVKIIGIQEAMPILKEVLSDEDNQKREKALRITYHLTDGSNSNTSIAKHISYSSEFVRLRQNEWADLGLLERDKPNEPYYHIISLEEAGIEIPDIPDPEEEEVDESADGTEETEEQEEENKEAALSDY